MKGEWNAVNTYGAWAVMLVVFVVAVFTVEPDGGGIHTTTSSDLVGVLAILLLLMATPVLLNLHAALAPLRRRSRLARVGGSR